MAWSPGLHRLFDRSIGIALDRQSWLTSRIGDWDWSVALDAGAMTFTDPTSGETVSTAIQILGTESDISDTWLWGWANEASGIPLSLLTIARALGQAGSERGVPEFNEPSLDRADVDGHTLACVASAAHPVAGYYRAPYEGGALFVLLTGPELVAPAPLSSLIRFTTGWGRVISTVPDQLSEPRAALKAYARHLGLQLDEETDGHILFSGPSGAVKVQFDALDRTLEIQAKALP